MQTRIRFVDPSITARTRCRLGLNVRFVLLFAWLTLWPDWCFFEQMSHENATGILLYLDSVEGTLS